MVQHLVELWACMLIRRHQHMHVPRSSIHVTAKFVWSAADRLHFWAVWLRKFCLFIFYIFIFFYCQKYRLKRIEGPKTIYLSLLDFNLNLNTHQFTRATTWFFGFFSLLRALLTCRNKSLSNWITWCARRESECRKSHTFQTSNNNSNNTLFRSRRVRSALIIGTDEIDTQLKRIESECARAPSFIVQWTRRHMKWERTHCGTFDLWHGRFFYFTFLLRDSHRDFMVNNYILFTTHIRRVVMQSAKKHRS